MSTLIDRQIEVIARACAVSDDTVRAVIAGQRVDDVSGERVRAALSLIGFIPPIPRVAMPVAGRRRCPTSDWCGREVLMIPPEGFADTAGVLLRDEWFCSESCAESRFAIDPHDSSTWPDQANREDIEADEAKRRDDNGPGF
jgi:hypothetical protein